jgi:hypothetical protein
MKTFDFKCGWNTFQSTSDSKYLFMNCDIGKMLQWNTFNRQEDHIYDCGELIKCIIVTKDNQYVIVNTLQGKLIIFDISNKILHS